MSSCLRKQVVSEWLGGIAGLEHKAPLIEEQLFIQLWTQGLPLSVGGVPVDLEALCGERSLAYLHQLASRFDAHDVDAWTRLADFSEEEAEIFGRELHRLRIECGAANAPTDQGSAQPLAQENAKKTKRKKRRAGPEMKRLGEDPELRRQAAEKIQARQRGRRARREAEERRRERSGKGRRQTAAEKMREERLRHEELIRQHEAATKIQAAQRGKQQRRQGRARMSGGKRQVSLRGDSRHHSHPRIGQQCRQ